MLRKFPGKIVASLLVAALVAAAIPSLAVAGGCDEPGYTGGCHKKNSISPGLPPPHVKRPHPRDYVVYGPGGLRSWLVVILGGFLR